MRYLGGKSRIANQVAGYINSIRRQGQSYWEPFVGSAWILSKIKGVGPNYASDANGHLIAMWQALQGGWDPPSVVSEELYKDIQDDQASYPPELVAFVGFGCSFGGKWFGGYARGEGRNWAAEAKDSLRKKIARCQPITFFHADFISCQPPQRDMVIYCDPPYQYTTGYRNVPAWNPSAFWERVQFLSREGHTIVISEYHAPSWLSLVLEMETKTNLRTKKEGRANRTERLFVAGDTPSMMQLRLF